jgi:hypothetical protein
MELLADEAAKLNEKSFYTSRGIARVVGIPIVGGGSYH